MNILEWLKSENLTQGDLAEIIERDRCRAHRLCRGAKPTDEEANKLFIKSKGKVTPNDFYALPETIKLTKKPTRN